MQIVKANTGDIATIQRIAVKTWAVTYAEILSKEQTSYMLDMMYSDASLKKQMQEKRHLFFLIKSDDSDEYKGFISCEINYNNQPKTKIHKLYVLPQSQVSGLGKALIMQAEKVAKDVANPVLILNINRFNKSLGFYRRQGFVIAGEETIDIGKGYYMEDYILEKTI